MTTRARGRGESGEEKLGRRFEQKWGLGKEKGCRGEKPGCQGRKNGRGRGAGGGGWLLSTRESPVAERRAGQ